MPRWTTKPADAAYALVWMPTASAAAERIQPGAAERRMHPPLECDSTYHQLVVVRALAVCYTRTSSFARCLRYSSAARRVLKVETA